MSPSHPIPGRRDRTDSYRYLFSPHSDVTHPSPVGVFVRGEKSKEILGVQRGLFRSTVDIGPSGVFPSPGTKSTKHDIDRVVSGIVYGL